MCILAMRRGLNVGSQMGIGTRGSKYAGQIMQDLDGHGEDFKLYSQSNKKALRDSEQRSVPTGVCRITRGTEEDAGTLLSRQA